jgi:hypothetical protein
VSSPAPQGPPDRLVEQPWLQPLQRDLERTLERLRGRSLARLARPLDQAAPQGPTAAQAAADLAQQLVDAAAALEGGPARRLPDVEVYVLPDLLAVAGHDLVMALSGAPRVAEGEQRADLAAAALRSLRHAL